MTRHLQQEGNPITTPAGGKKVFSWIRASPACIKCHSSANNRSCPPRHLLSSNELFFFSQLITSLPHPCGDKSFPFHVTSWNILARWDVALFMNHFIKPIRSSNFLSWICFLIHTIKFWSHSWHRIAIPQFGLVGKNWVSLNHWFSNLSQRRNHWEVLLKHRWRDPHWGADTARLGWDLGMDISNKFPDCSEAAGPGTPFRESLH